jgi:hypothetical protein
MLAWMLLMWAVSLAAPGASYYLTWPLLFALLPLSWVVLIRERDRHRGLELGVLAVAVLPAVFLVPGVAYQMVGLLHRMEYMLGMAGTVPVLGVWALFIAPLIGLYLLHLNALSGGATRPYRWAVPGVTALVALTLLGWASITSGFDAEHPRPNHIAYELNADTGEARFVSLDPELDSWTSQFFPDDPATADFEIQAGMETTALSAPTTAVPLETAAVDVMTDGTTDGVRTLTFRITSPRGAPELEAEIIAKGEILSASIDGRALDLTDYAPARDGELRFGYAGIDTDGIELTLAVRSTDAIELAVTEATYGLPQIPGLTVQPRADDQMPAAGFPPDATIVRKSFSI